MLDCSAFSALKGRSITRVSIDPGHSFSECWWLLLHTSDGACFELHAEPVVTWGWEEANEVRLRPKLHPSEPVAASQSVDIRLHDIWSVRVFLRCGEAGDFVHGVAFSGKDAKSLAVFAGVMPNALTVISTELSTRYYDDCDLFALKSVVLDPDPEPEVDAAEMGQRFDGMTRLLPHLKDKTRGADSKVHSKGLYHELPIYSYQRAGMKRGKLIANPARIRNWDEVHITHFNAAGQIVRVEEGNALGQFHTDYVVQHSQGFMVYSYDEDGEPLSATFYRVVDGRIQGALAHGKYGGSDERYSYDERGLLASIRVHSFSHNPAEEGSVNTEHFTHDEAGVLRRIELHYELGDSDVIYKA